MFVTDLSLSVAIILAVVIITFIQDLLLQILKFVTRVSVPTTYLSSIRYSFRLLVFKYLQLNTYLRTSLYTKLLELLIQTFENEQKEVIKGVGNKR